jgi:hypothetical protein
MDEYRKLIEIHKYRKRSGESGGYVEHREDENMTGQQIPSGVPEWIRRRGIYSSSHELVVDPSLGKSDDIPTFDGLVRRFEEMATKPRPAGWVEKVYGLLPFGLGRKMREGYDQRVLRDLDYYTSGRVTDKFALRQRGRQLRVDISEGEDSGIFKRNIDVYTILPLGVVGNQIAEVRTTEFGDMAQYEISLSGGIIARRLWEPLLELLFDSENGPIAGKPDVKVKKDHVTEPVQRAA